MKNQNQRNNLKYVSTRNSHHPIKSMKNERITERQTDKKQEKEKEKKLMTNDNTNNQIKTLTQNLYKKSARIR